jgi:hypothetical protein
MHTSKLFEKMARDRSPDEELMPFKGMGAMVFDDYNYKSLNKIVFNMKGSSK